MFRHKATRKRHGLARSLERAAFPERPHIGRGPRYLVHPEIAAACAPSLLAIAAVLRDASLTVGEDELGAVKSFITDGQSSFFGRDATASMREAVRLQHMFVGPKPAAVGREQVTPADATVQLPGPALIGS